MIVIHSFIHRMVIAPTCILDDASTMGFIGVAILCVYSYVYCWTPTLGRQYLRVHTGICAEFSPDVATLLLHNATSWTSNTGSHERQIMLAFWWRAYTWRIQGSRYTKTRISLLPHIIAVARRCTRTTPGQLGGQSFSYH